MKAKLRNLKVLSVRQPFAHAIIHGDKRIENRTWFTSYRGPILIHASSTRAHLPDFLDAEMVFGAIIGVVDLIDCLPLAELPAELIDNPHALGPWCWILANPRPLTPYPCKGLLRLFSPPAGLLLPQPIE